MFLLYDIIVKKPSEGDVMKNNKYNNISTYRNELGLTLFDLATLTNLSVGYLCHLENGSRKNPSMKTMIKICKALNKSLSDVFYL